MDNGASKTRDKSGSMASHMRCTAMLEKVARDSKKMARFWAAVGPVEEGVGWVKTSAL